MDSLMNIRPTKLQGSWIIETIPFTDERGQFVRLFCNNELKDIHHGKPLEQVNYSITVKKGAVRGLHYQRPPKAETKLIRCLKGSIYDVMVDLRKDSKTFLQWHGEILSGKNMKMSYISEGFAHGFQALEDNCEMLYLHTEFYCPEHEVGIRYDDPALKIDWPLEVAEISRKDIQYPLLNPDFSGIAV